MIKSTGEEDSLVSMLPGGYLDGQMESTVDSTGKGWGTTGSGRRVSNQQEG